MSSNSTIYEITLSINGDKHVVETFCVEKTDVSLIKAIKSAISSLKSLGFEGPIQYCTHKERGLLPKFSTQNFTF